MKPSPFTTITVGSRTALLHTPPSPPSWLLVCLHPSGSNGRAFANITQFVPLADANGFACVFPDAIHGEWNANGGNGTDDLTFLHDLVIQVMQNNVSITHVAFVGYSNGAQMASGYAVAHAQDVEVLATCSGGLTNPIMQAVGMPSQAVNVISFWGTADSIYPYDPAPYRYGPPAMGAPQNHAVWSMTNGCTEDTGPQAVEGSSTVTLQTASDGTNGTQVQLYTITDGGHTWPGSQQTALVGVLGKTDLSIDASSLIWEFCKASVAA